MRKVTNKQVNMNRMRAKLQQRHAEQSHGPYFWVFGYTKREMKPVIYGWFPTESEANQWAFTYTNGDYQVYPLQTKSRASATSVIKAQRLGSEKMDLDDALNRVRHRGKDINIE